MSNNNSPLISGAAASPAPEWSQAVAREIALDQTLVDTATLADELGGPRIQLISQDGRDLYIRRCTDAAGKLGHPCSPSELPAADDTTVEEVGDGLFQFARS